HTRFSRDWSSDVCSSDLGLHTASLVALVSCASGDGERMSVGPTSSVPGADTAPVASDTGPGAGVPTGTDGVPSSTAGPSTEPSSGATSPPSTPSEGGSGGMDPGPGPGGTGGVGMPPEFEEPTVVVPETVECTGAFPTDDVTAAPYRVAAGGESWGALPHFWTTYGLGRMGLYLDRDLLAPEFQAQDRDSHDGRRWSQVLREQTVEAVEKLELRSVRGHGLFHDDIGIYSEDESGNPVYDFTRSDSIFDFLVEHGIAPIVELAPMPSALAADPSQTVFDWNMIVSPPKDYAKWEGLVREFVQHSVDRYGAETVQNWYWEVWNEPECCRNKFWKGSLQDYFQL